MLSSSETAKFTNVLDAAAIEHAELQRLAEVSAEAHVKPKGLRQSIREASHRQAAAMTEILGPPSARWDAAREILLGHRLHRDYLLQSEFISHALRKPFGYAGDHALMELIYLNRTRGDSSYAQAKNDVYQCLPAAQAVRQRASGLERRLRRLAEGTRVLSLACGRHGRSSASMPTVSLPST